MRGLCFFVGALLLLGSCEDFGASDSIDGMWVCSESRANGIRKVYNIDIDRGSISDTTQFVIYNMFNLGYDFGIEVKLNNASIFTITGADNVMYSVSGFGIFDPEEDNYRIEWTCNVSGPGINEQYVNIISRKP